MRDPARVPVIIRRAFGRLQYLRLVLIGWLGDRWPLAYAVDTRARFRRLVRDLARARADDDADPRSLRWSETSDFSQNGEDGIIREIFTRIGTGERRMVEIGAANGEQNCTRALVERGWGGVWIEADPALAAQAALVAPEVTVLAEPAWRQTVAAQLAGAGVPTDLDLLVIDVDGDDLGLLRATLEAYSPRAVVIEYNAAFTPTAMWSTSPTATAGWDGTFRHGASLGALDHAASGAGYDLVYCDSSGVNAFFVRRDLAGAEFTRPGDLAYHARVASFGNLPSGHPLSRRAMAPMGTVGREEFASVTIDELRVTRGPVAPRTPLDVRLTIANGSGRTLTSGETNPVRVSLRWVDDEVGGIPELAPRGPLPRPLPPGGVDTLRLWLPAPEDPGLHTLRATVVCEHCFWREALGGEGAHVDRTVEVAAPGYSPPTKSKRNHPYGHGPARPNRSGTPRV